LKGISTVCAHFEHAAIEAHMGIWRCFKVEVVPECQLSAAAFKKEKKNESSRLSLSQPDHQSTPHSALCQPVGSEFRHPR
jgi:hypothetical protein